MLLSVVRRRSTHSVIIACGLWLSGCGCADGEPTHHDAGRDTGASRSEADTNPRADHDAGPTGQPDAGQQAGGDEDDAVVEWQPLPGLPEGCIIEQATNPDTLLAIEWVPCRDGSTGCRELAPDPRFQRVTLDIGYRDETRECFALVQALRSDALQRPIKVIACTDAGVVGAWRTPPPSMPGVCQLWPLGVGAGAFAFATNAIVADSVPQDRLFHASLLGTDGVGPGITLFEGARARSASPERIAVSATTAAAEIHPGGYVVVLEGDTVEPLEPPAREVAGTAQNLHVVGRHVLWEAWGSRIRLLHGAQGESTAVYHARDSGDVRGFATDGRDLAWVEGYDRPCTYGCPEPYGRVELWTAHYERDPSDLAPRRVRELSARIAKARVGGGFYGHTDYTDWHRVVLYRLSDGRRGTWTLPRDSSARGIVWIAETEVAVAAGGGVLYRIDFSAFSWEDG